MRIGKGGLPWQPSSSRLRTLFLYLLTSAVTCWRHVFGLWIIFSRMPGSRQWKKQRCRRMSACARAYVGGIGSFRPLLRWQWLNKISSTLASQIYGALGGQCTSFLMIRNCVGPSRCHQNLWRHGIWCRNFKVESSPTFSFCTFFAYKESSRGKRGAFAIVKE